MRRTCESEDETSILQFEKAMKPRPTDLETCSMTDPISQGHSCEGIRSDSVQPRFLSSLYGNDLYSNRNEKGIAKQEVAMKFTKTLDELCRGQVNKYDVLLRIAKFSGTSTNKESENVLVSGVVFGLDGVLAGAFVAEAVNTFVWDKKINCDSLSYTQFSHQSFDAKGRTEYAMAFRTPSQQETTNVFVQQTQERLLLIPSVEGNTPLHLAIKRFNPKLVSASKINTESKAPLYLAAFYKSCRSVLNKPPLAMKQHLTLQNTCSLSGLDSRARSCVQIIITSDHLRPGQINPFEFQNVSEKEIFERKVAIKKTPTELLDELLNESHETKSQVNKCNLLLKFLGNITLLKSLKFLESGSIRVGGIVFMAGVINIVVGPLNTDNSFIWEEKFNCSFSYDQFSHHELYTFDANGCTICHAMVSSDPSQEEMTRFLDFLVEQGHLGLLLVPNGEGNTPLHIAIKLNNPRLVSTLLKYSSPGAFLIANSKGKTPLHLATFDEQYRDVLYKFFAEVEIDSGLLQQHPLKDKNPQLCHSTVMAPSLQILNNIPLFNKNVGSTYFDLEQGSLADSEELYTEEDRRRIRRFTKTTVKSFQTTTPYVIEEGPFKYILNEVQIVHRLTVLKVSSGYSASEESESEDIQIQYGNQLIRQDLSSSKRKKYLMNRKMEIEDERSTNSDCD